MKLKKLLRDIQVESFMFRELETLTKEYRVQEAAQINTRSEPVD